MARFLIFQAATARSGKDVGDAIAVFPDTHQFGQFEDIRVWQAAEDAGGAVGPWPADFYVIDIPGMPIEVAKRFEQPWYRPATVLDPEFLSPDPEDRIVELGKRRWQLGVNDRLPGSVRAQLRREEFLVIEPYNQQTIDALNNYIRDRAELDVFITDTPIDP